MKVLSGRATRTAPTTGEILFDGRPWSVPSPSATARSDGIVIIHQELALSPHLSIAENIFLGNEHATRAASSTGTGPTPRPASSSRASASREEPDTKIVDIGVGKQQLVEIAKALSKDVKLLILDEPTAALNDEDSAHLLGLIRKLTRAGDHLRSSSATSSTRSPRSPTPSRSSVTA
ncbi:MAG: ATP-binding cassette domain-containing protein [Dermatophilaceae bacterium]